MLPIVFEWQWDLSHFIFMGLFYAALGVISLFLLYAVVTTVKQMYTGEYVKELSHGHGHEEHEEHEEGEVKAEA